MAIVEYVVHINKGSKSGRKFVYNFGPTRGIELRVGKTGSTIRFTMGVRKTADDLVTFRVKLFRDAFRKACLLSSLINDTGLEVRSLTVSINGETVSYGSGDEHFPFMFSMLEGVELNLPESWRSDAVLNRVLIWKKSDSDGDYLCCAFNAFLASRTRHYRIDRFLNLWTAMNALYNENARRYEVALAASQGKTRESLSGKQRIVGGDLVSFCAYVYSVGSHGFKKSCLRGDEFTRVFRMVDSLVYHGVITDFDALYVATLEGNNAAIPRELIALAEECGATPYALLLLVVPYYLRCNYFHGSKSTNILSAYNDSEVADLGLACYFLERHLVEAIPALFKSDNLCPSVNFEEMASYVRSLKK